VNQTNAGKFHFQVLKYKQLDNTRVQSITIVNNKLFRYQQQDTTKVLSIKVPSHVAIMIRVLTTVINHNCGATIKIFDAPVTASNLKLGNSLVTKVA
jgi:hypothetical protein